LAIALSGDRHYRIHEERRRAGNGPAEIANHESPRTPKLYGRREEEISLDEVERIAI
jgi:hypothetical protein